jgi:hypothetical protein
MDTKINERNLVQLILEYNLDSLKDVLDAKEFRRVSTFEIELWDIVSQNALALYNNSISEHVQQYSDLMQSWLTEMEGLSRHDKANYSLQIVAECIKNHLTDDDNYAIIKKTLNIPDL